MFDALKEFVGSNGVNAVTERLQRGEGWPKRLYAGGSVKGDVKFPVRGYRRCSNDLGKSSTREITVR